MNAFEAMESFTSRMAMSDLDLPQTGRSNRKMSEYNVPQTTIEDTVESPVITNTLVERANSESAIRPSTTKMFNKEWVGKPFEFPTLYEVPDIQFIGKETISQSSRAIVQNALLLRRHFDK